MNLDRVDDWLVERMGNVAAAWVEDLALVLLGGGTLIVFGVKVL